VLRAPADELGGPAGPLWKSSTKLHHASFITSIVVLTNCRQDAWPHEFPGIAQSRRRAPRATPKI